MRDMNYISKIDSFTAITGLIGGAVASFLAPVAPFLVMAFVLIVCDLYTGTRAAKKNKETITDPGLGRSIEKMILYFIAIFLSEAFQRVFLESTGFGMVENFPIVYIVSITISIRELKSNFENIEAVTGTDLLTNIKEKLTGILDLFKSSKEKDHGGKL